MPADERDPEFLRACIELSRRSLDDEGLTPFGAIVVRDGVEIARGVSSVIARRDPTAHAEVMALRNAGFAAGTHLFPGATMYCSGEPCPMCLVACYWAGIDRIVCAARIDDSAVAGFEDRWYYGQLRLAPDDREVRVTYADRPLRDEAAAVLAAWRDRAVGGSAF